MHLGENAAYTVVRELKEETGLSIQPQRIIGLLSPTDSWIYPNGDQVQGVVTFFLARLADEASDNLIQVDQTETSQAKWVPPDQVLKLPTHPRMNQVNHSVLKHLNKGYFII
jgi:8-oxo-dGTP pyrophosphatase MutT (NUDIX family)